MQLDNAKQLEYCKTVFGNRFLESVSVNKVNMVFFALFPDGFVVAELRKHGHL